MIASVMIKSIICICKFTNFCYNLHCFLYFLYDGKAEGGVKKKPTGEKAKFGCKD
jgi:hypothetical protein